MGEKKVLSRMVILKNFFGYRPGETLKDFTAEIKELNDEELTELATLAAVELDVEVAVKGA
jgi:hypothetical protein